MSSQLGVIAAVFVLGDDIQQEDFLLATAIENPPLHLLSMPRR
jgi:hypothetical protein